MQQRTSERPFGPFLMGSRSPTGQCCMLLPAVIRVLTFGTYFCRREMLTTVAVLAPSPISSPASDSMPQRSIHRHPRLRRSSTRLQYSPCTRSAEHVSREGSGEGAFRNTKNGRGRRAAHRTHAFGTSLFVMTYFPRLTMLLRQLACSCYLLVRSPVSDPRFCASTRRFSRLPRVPHHRAATPSFLVSTWRQVRTHMPPTSPTSISACSRRSASIIHPPGHSRRYPSPTSVDLDARSLLRFQTEGR